MNRGRTAALFVLAFVLRLGNRALFYDLHPDKIRQITAAGNLLRGRGIADCWVEAADLARVSCEPQTLWPAGYPLLSAALTSLTGNFIVTDALLGAIALVLVLLAANGLIRRFQTGSGDETAYRWFLVFSAIGFAPYIYLTTTDFLSVGLYLTAAAGALRIVDRPPAVGTSVAVGALSWLAAVTRYNYVPLLVCIPFTLAGAGVLRGDRRLFRSAAVCTGVVLLLVVAFRVALPHNGALLGASSSGGWYPGNLLSLDPFAAKAFLYLDPVLRRLDKIHPALDSGVLIVAHLFALLLLAGSAAWALGTRRVTPAEADARPTAVLATVTTAAVVATLAWLSLRVTPENLPYNHHWTYLWETRYYAPALLLIVLLAFALAWSSSGGATLLVRGARVTVAVAFLYAVAFDLWTAYTLLGRHDLSRTTLAEPAADIRVGSEVRRVAQSEQRPVVVAFPTVGEAYAAGRLRDFDFGTVRASRPVVLLVLASRDGAGAGRAAAWLDSARAVPLIGRPGEVLFRVEVNP